MSASASAGPGGPSRPLARGGLQGTLIAERFKLETLIASEAGTEVYRARDAQTGAPVRVRMIGRAPAGADTVLASWAAIAHRNLVATVAVGRHGAGVYVVSEDEDGHTLRELIDAQRTQGQALGATQAFTILGHVAAALEEPAPGMAHGGLNPACVVVTRAGRIKVADLGATAVLPPLAMRGSPADAPPGIYVAPEITAGGAATPASDVYALGAMMYELLTGSPPVPPLRPPSQVVAGVPPTLDAVLGQALAVDPRVRFPGPRAFVDAVATALGAQPAGDSTGAFSAPPGRTFDPSAAAGMAEDAERWLVQKDRLDYGPFSLSHVMAELERGVFGGDDFLVDMDSGAREKIKEHPRLADFAREAERKLEAVRRAKAEQVHEKVEKKKSRATLLILGSVVVALGIGFAAYLAQRKAAQQDVLASRVAEADIDEFLKNVKFELGTKKRPTTTRRARAGGGDDFGGVTNLGDVTQGGGDEILGDAVIQRTMMANYRKLIPCVMDERRRNAGLSDIDLEFVVLGSGKVSAVRVNGQRNGAFPSCVLGRMQSFSFPSFNGKKTIASWSMSMR